jgi:hypothetical protein
MRTSDPSKRLQFLEEFKTRLVDLVSDGSRQSARDQKVPAILATGEERYFGDDYIFVGSGTSGQRIYFLKDSSEPGGGQEESKRVRWMGYSEPRERDRQFGERYWKKYMEIFGSEKVDLLEGMD